MRPYFWSRMICHKALAGFTVPITCTAITTSKSLISILAKLLSRRMPALAISTSTRPKLLMVCSTRWATPASSVTDAPLAIAVPPAALISLTTFSAASDEPPEPSTEPPRSLTTTFAPRLANSRAWARPRPPPAPVTITTLPSKRMVMGLYSCDLEIGSPSDGRAAGGRSSHRRAAPLSRHQAAQEGRGRPFDEGEEEIPPEDGGRHEKRRFEPVPDG